MVEPATAAGLANAPIVFFDGACPLCNRSVAFLAARDSEGRLRFAHLQGEVARGALDPSLRDVGRDGTVVLLEPSAAGRVSVRSAAVLRALAHADARSAWLARLAEHPLAVRLLDVLYRALARRRDRWFGREEACTVPDPALRARFLD
jgi:predicted DCC family thiol-disulfide oxidoreductase YuxK